MNSALHSTFPIITEEIQALLAEDGRHVESIEPSMHLLRELGLSSLLLARLVLNLESRFGIDPFSESHSITEAQTVDDLARIYAETSAAPAAA
jgi:acyl carrier protein